MEFSPWTSPEDEEEERDRLEPRLEESQSGAQFNVKSQRNKVQGLAPIPWKVKSACTVSETVREIILQRSQSHIDVSRTDSEQKSTTIPQLVDHTAAARGKTDETENEALKQEIVVLKNALLAGMRGKGKFVSGAYRKLVRKDSERNSIPRKSASSSNLMQQTTTPRGFNVSSKPDKQESIAVHVLRAKRLEQELSLKARELYMARIELDTTKQEVVNLTLENKTLATDKVELERRLALSANRKLTVGSDTTKGNGESSTGEKKSLQQAIASKEKTISFLYTQVSSLREERTRQELEHEKQVNKLKSKVQSTKQDTLAAQQEAQFLKKQLELLSTEKKEYQAKVSMLAEKLAQAQQQVHTSRSHVTVDRAHDQQEQQEQQRRENEEQIEREQELVEKVLEAEKAARNAQQQAHDLEKENGKLRSLVDSLEDRLEQRTQLSHIGQLKLQTAEETVRKARESETRLKELADNLRKELADTRVKLGEMNEQNHILEQGQTRLRELQNQHEQTSKALTSLCATLGWGNVSLDLNPRFLCEKARELLALVDKLREEKAHLLLQCGTLRSELNSAKQALAAQQITQDEQNKRFNQALHSFIRLCVVTPVVNVAIHVDQEHLLKESVKASCPNSAIRKLLETKVLPKFTHVFLQNAKDLAPDGSTPLSKWVSELVHDVSASIQKQVEASSSSNDVCQ